MNRFGRTVYAATGAAIVLTFAGASVVAQTASDDAKKQDREKIEKELQDLQEQRSKLDTRIRELRKQAGREGATSTFRFVDPSGKTQAFTVPGAGAYYFGDGKLKGLKELTPEQKKHIEEAMAEAKKAMEKAKKDLPEGFVLPDIDGILDSTMRLRTFGPGDVYVSPKFDSKEFKEQMEKMRDTIRKNVVVQPFMAPRVYSTPRTLVTPTIPAVPSGPLFREVNPDLRNEIRELRRELEQLREEIRRGRGESSKERKSTFLQPYSEIL